MKTRSCGVDSLKRQVLKSSQHHFPSLCGLKFELTLHTSRIMALCLIKKIHSSYCIHGLCHSLSRPDYTLLEITGTCFSPPIHLMRLGIKPCQSAQVHLDMVLKQRCQCLLLFLVYQKVLLQSQEYMMQPLILVRPQSFSTSLHMLDLFSITIIASSQGCVPSCDGKVVQRSPSKSLLQPRQKPWLPEGTLSRHLACGLGGDRELRNVTVRPGCNVQIC